METVPKKQPPAFQFYASDFIGGTSHFSDAETGLYIRLLCAQWFDGSLPNDDEELSSYGKGNTRLDRVKAKFTLCQDGRLRHHKLEEVRLKQEAYRQKQSAKGRASAQARFNRGSTAVQPEGQPEGNSPVSSLHTPIKRKTNIPTEEEVLARASGKMTEAQARQWFEDMTLAGWADRDGVDIGNWSHALMTHARYLRNNSNRNANSTNHQSSPPNRNVGYNANQPIDGLERKVR